MLASYRGHIEVVELLLMYDSDVNLTTVVNQSSIYSTYATTAMIICTIYKHPCALFNQHKQQGWTALQRVCLYNQNRYPKAKYKPSETRGEIAKLLIDHGTDIKKVDKVSYNKNQGIIIMYTS